ncbi:copper resistance protein CopC [Dermabacter sp. p3-SID358]|uniref:copper resistance CopC family protein n=1 Tax=Dermabacter sp. p3-SID358 TaxID=2916114 RepID=UPI0021A6131A|nr:copper resistance CopC family protein [Dermabacter sp. p3-SID358]MCT1867708.1 copper resistance protein CopC [Dermabacter sp. p3-SID358]
MRALSHRTFRFLTFVCAALAAMIMMSAPALAHDRLVGSSPEDGAEILQGEARTITLEFSAEPLELGNEVRVKDSAGTVLFEGEPKVDGHEVRVELEKLPVPGELTLEWRVVSSDGHPISGALSYTVTEDPSKPTEEAASSATEESAGDGTGGGPAAGDSGKSGDSTDQGDKNKNSSAEATSAPVETPDKVVNEEKKSFNWGLWLPIIVAAILPIAVAIWLLSKKDDEDDKGEEGDE